jgi:hypothetical protein
MIGATVVATAALQGNKDLVMIGGVTNVMSAVIAARPGIETPHSRLKERSWLSRVSAAQRISSSIMLSNSGSCSAAIYRFCRLATKPIGSRR